MNKNNNQKQKLPRAIVMAKNKKAKEIENLLSLRDEMIKNSIDSTLIKKFIDEEYEKINKKYELKIEKYYKSKNSNGNKNNLTSKEIKQKRDKAVEFLLKNKTFLEEHGASKEYIKKYVEKQYQEINEYYVESNFATNNPDEKIDDDQINFID